jgi:hypothetical protein
LLEDVNAVAERGAAAGISATPSAFVGGRLTAGRLGIDQFGALADPLLAAKPRRHGGGGAALRRALKRKPPRPPRRDAAALPAGIRLISER